MLAGPSCQIVQARRHDGQHSAAGDQTFEDLLVTHPHDTEQRGVHDGDWSTAGPAA
jgi:hypothetical protein